MCKKNDNHDDDRAKRGGSSSKVYTFSRRGRLFSLKTEVEDDHGDWAVKQEKKVEGVGRCL